MADRSLHILLPSHRAPSTSVGTTAEKSPSTAELETLSRTVIDAMNSRSFDKIAALVGSKYKANIDGLPKTESYGENLEHYRSLMQRDPTYHVEVVDIKADVDEGVGYGIGEFAMRGVSTGEEGRLTKEIVYCLLSVTGTPSTVRRQSVSVVEWYRRNGQWQFFSATAMRGMDGTLIPWLGLT